LAVWSDSSALRTDYNINRVSLIGWAINKIRRNRFELNWEWFRGGVSTRSRILDIGCGYGELLRNMRAQGFRHLTAVDSFIGDSVKADGLRIVRGESGDLDERFDFVMLHHSLEHMPNPLGALAEVRRLLRRGGAVLVRVPVAGTWAEQHYGVNWIGLARYWCDASEWTLLASESYSRGFSPHDRETKAWPFLSRFTASEIMDARELAADLNRAEDGDIACFILRSL
jgi:SAM-dependent methyltransferase